MVRLDFKPTAGRRQPAAGAAVQPGRHSPETGGLPPGQVVHSVALGPEHSVHEGSQVAQPLSLVAVHMAVSNWPDAHVAVQVWHAVLPVPLAKVSAVQPLQFALPGDGCAVPAAQSGQLVAAVPGCAVPAGQVRQDGWAGSG